MTVAGRVDALVASLAGTYPTRLAVRTMRAGSVTCVVAPDAWEYEPLCDPPVADMLNAQVEVLAAGTGAQQVADLLTHVEAVEALIVAAGWYPTRCQADAVADVPALVFDCTSPR